MIKKIVINIVQDDYPANPRDDENLGTIAYISSHHVLGDEQLDEEAINQICDDKNYISLPVYAYIHGNVMLNTHGYSCPWDSGQCGIIYASKEHIKNVFSVKRISPKLRKTILDEFKGEIETFSNYLNGQSYGYEIREYSYDDKPMSEDSCYGYDDVDECTRIALESLLMNVHAN